MEPFRSPNAFLLFLPLRELKSKQVSVDSSFEATVSRIYRHALTFLAYSFSLPLPHITLLFPPKLPCSIGGSRLD